MTPEDKRTAITEAAQLGAAYFTSLLEERLTRDDAMSMANNFVIMFLATKGVITAIPQDPPEPWKQ